MVCMDGKGQFKSLLARVDGIAWLVDMYGLLGW